MNRPGRILLVLTFAMIGLCFGCRSLPVPARASAPASGPHYIEAAEGNVITNYPAKVYHFSACQKLNPGWWFGNADDPIPPDWYRPKNRCRTFLWHLRNPCHNFTFFVIGIADKPFTRVGRYPAAISNPHGGWNWAVCRYRRLRLPFVAYAKGRFQFYWGWRRGGNFGMKFNFGGKATPPRPATESS